MAEKKIAKKFTIFFRTPKLQQKKFAISKISKKKFCKINYFANIKYNRNSRKYCEKNLRRNIFVKKKNFRQKNSIKIFFTKNKFVEKKFSKKKIQKKYLK